MGIGSWGRKELHLKKGEVMVSLTEVTFDLKI